MTDVYATIETADEAVQERLADVLELRGTDLQQQAMLDDYLADLMLPDGARVLEIGCGTGTIARVLARRPGIGEVIGIDPSPVFVDRARRLAAGIDNLWFRQGDGRELPFADASFDAVVCHTVLSHVPGPERVVAEALRVTAPGGSLAVFDGDYATTTVATQAHDPLQACADAAMDALVNDRYLVRRLPSLVREAGWDVVRIRSHGYVEITDPGYTLTLIDRGAELVPGGEALRQEARRRIAAGTYFAHIAYASLIATRPV